MRLGVLVSQTFILILSSIALPITVQAAEGSAGRMIEEILVTATKRATAEAAQDVPISITAFSGAQLEAARVERLSDVRFLVPNAQLQPMSTIPNGTLFSVRGAGTSSSIPSDDPAVGVFVDGVVLGILNGSNLDTFDLESMEILRGPQGTLFGRNVTAGAVLARTARPSFERSGDARIVVGTDGRFDAAAKITGTLIEDRLAGKLAVMYLSTDGNFSNTNGNGTPIPGGVLGRRAPLESDYGENENIIIRPSLRFTPNESLTIDVIGEYSDTEGDSNAPHKQRDNTQGFPASQGPDLDDWDEVSLSTNGINEYEYYSLVIDATLETERGAWTSVTGYRDMDQYSMIDTDGGAGDIFVFVSNPEQDQFSQEIRWSGTLFDDNFEVTVGGYYFTQTINYIEGRHIFGGCRFIVGLGTCGAVGGIAPIQQVLGGDVDHDAFGVFVDTSWNVTENFIVNLGLRYTDEEKDADISVPGDCSLTNPSSWSPSCNPAFSDSESWSNVSPAVGVQYYFDEQTQVYASWKRGFRSGGFNIRNSGGVVAVSPKYDEETVDTFEIGVKADISETLRVNAAYFHSTYEDLQRVAVQPDSTQRTLNAAEATIQGGEVEVNWLATANFSIAANIGILDGSYDDMSSGALLALNNARLVSRSPDGPFSVVTEDDLDLARLPDFNAALTAIYDQPLGDAGLLTFRLSTKYVDERWNNDSNLYELPDYTTVDASIMYTSPGARWTATVFGKNMTSADLFTSYTETSLYAYHVVQQPERYGIELQFSF
ncbi:MAG: TonB-dependent receptor [Pseudomonadales bacterium]